MRIFLDKLYDVSGALAGVFLCAIALIVLTQVGLNVIDKVSEAVTGEAGGLVLPSYAEFAGYFLAASSFLAIAHMLRGGAHIRVNLIITRLSPGPRRMIELTCTGFGAVLAAYAAYWMALLTLESLEFGDVSPGIVPAPPWIPQTPLVIGLAIAAIFFLDAFVQVLRGGTPRHLIKEAQAEAAADGADH